MQLSHSQLPSTPIRGTAKLTKHDLDPFDWEQFNRIDPRDVAGDDSYDPFIVAEDVFLRSPVDAVSETPRKQKGFAAYVVFNGRLMGVFQQWSAASWQVIKYSCAVYKGYTSLEDARNAWDHALVAGTWGHPAHQCEQQSLPPFHGYIVGGSEDQIGNQYRQQAQRFGQYLAANPQAKRKMPVRPLKTEAVAAMRSFGSQGPVTPTKPREALSAAHQEIHGAIKLEDGGSQSDGLATSIKLRGSPFARKMPSRTPKAEDLEAPISQVPVASVGIRHPQASGGATKSRFATPSPSPSPVRNPHTRARTGNLAQHRLPLSTDGPPASRLTSEEAFYVVAIGHSPGVYLGRAAAHTAAGPYEDAHVIKCFNEISAHRLYARLYDAGELVVLADN